VSVLGVGRDSESRWVKELRVGRGFLGCNRWDSVVVGSDIGCRRERLREADFRLGAATLGVGAAILSVQG